MTRLASTLLALAIASPLAACSSAPPQVTVHTEKAPERQLVVTGTATLQVSPDCADLTMTLSATAMRPGVAVEQVRARQATLVAALRKLGIEAADLKLSTLGVQPVHELVEQRSILKGYDARITLTVTTRDFDKLGPLMEAGADAGVTELASQFRRSDLEGLKKQVREQALLAARDKARHTASTLGIQLGGVSGVIERSASYLFSNAYFPTANVATTMNDGAASLGGELQPLTLDITVTYDLPAS